MEDYEEKVKIKIDQKFVYADWLRYRDDTWLIWEHSLEELDYFMAELNKIHSHIQWTKEVEENGIIHFLDVLVKRECDGSFTTTVYRKETHSDRYLHFSSNHPLQHKLSGLTTLMFRAYQYCSNDELLRAELDHLRKTFIDNGYPEELVSIILKKTPDEVDSEKVGENITDEEEEDVKGFLVVPYVKEVESILKSLCKRLGIKLLYKRTMNLGNLLSPTRLPKPLLEKKNVVYKISCKECSSVYVGQTKRKLKTRIREHIAACDEADIFKAVDKDEKNDNGLPLHHLNTGHEFDFDNVEILDQESNFHRRLLLESININLESNSCNLLQGTKFNEVWGNFLRSFYG